MPDAPALSPSRVRAGRGPRPEVVAAVAEGHPLDRLVETERGPAAAGELGEIGEPQRALTVFLAGAECPFSCVYCDLWRHTTPGATPAGSLPRQIEHALRAAAGDGPFHRLKLYNASNWFEARAVPEADDARVLELAAGCAEVTVECHPRLVGDRAGRFAAALAARGARLEVALGLEVADSGVLRRLGKGATLEDFARAAERLAEWGAAWRAFVLVGAPFVTPEDRQASVTATVRWALDHGAGRVALIPVRGGTPPMDLLARRGDWVPPTLADLEDAFEAGLDTARASGRGIVTVDLWDAEGFAPCDSCRAPRLARLGRMNETGATEPRVHCAACGVGV